MYLSIKALHVASVITWMGGMIVVPAALAGGTGPGRSDAIRLHFSCVTTPAMILALVLGLWLAQDAGWFRAGWLQAKLILVIGMTGLHGTLSGQLRRLGTGHAHIVPVWIPWLSTAAMIVVLAIAILAVVKPPLW